MITIFKVQTALCIDRFSQIKILVIAQINGTQNSSFLVAFNSFNNKKMVDEQFIDYFIYKKNRYL